MKLTKGTTYRNGYLERQIINVTDNGGTIHYWWRDRRKPDTEPIRKECNIEAFKRWLRLPATVLVET